MSPDKLAALRERLRSRPFDWNEWQKIADIHEKNGHKTMARELRKEAARKRVEHG